MVLPEWRVDRVTAVGSIKLLLGMKSLKTCLIGASRFDHFMSGLKTLLLALLCSSVPARAADDPLVSAFATCAGRFSAELEHAWLMPDGRTDEIAHRRHQFIELLNAVVPSDRRGHALHLRIEAKVAHAGLLSQASFSNDAGRSFWALKRARSEIAYCTGFLLEG